MTKSKKNFKIDAPSGNYAKEIMKANVAKNPEMYAKNPALVYAHEKKITRRHNPEELMKVMFDCRGNMAAAARACGVRRMTFHRWLKADGNLDVVRQIDVEWNDRAEEVLNEHIDGGDLDAVKFRLKTKAKDRGYTEKMEIDTTVVIEVKVEE